MSDEQQLKGLGQALRDGTAEVWEIIESLRRFPQNATIRINRNMMHIKCEGETGKPELHWIDEAYAKWPLPKD